MLKLGIENFKSVDNLELELADLTILLGPPAAGKSNILDALALMGYLPRFKILSQEYGGSAGNLEPLPIIARFTSYHQLFKYYDLTRTIRLKISGDLNLDYTISYQAGAFRVVVNNIMIPWDLKTLRPDPMSELQSSVSSARIALQSRLYGFDRYGLMSDICSQPYPCSFHRRLSDLSQARNTPVNILSELGWNAPFIARRHSDVFRSVNYELEKGLGEKMELKLLRSGAVAIFDYDVELELTSVSEAVLEPSTSS